MNSIIRCNINARLFIHHDFFLLSILYERLILSSNTFPQTPAIAYNTQQSKESKDSISSTVYTLGSNDGDFVVLLASQIFVTFFLFFLHYGVWRVPVEKWHFILFFVYVVMWTLSSFWSARVFAPLLSATECRSPTCYSRGERGFQESRLLVSIIILGPMPRGAVAPRFSWLGRQRRAILCQVSLIFISL